MYAPSPSMRLSTSRHASRLDSTSMYYDAETTMTQVTEVPLKDTLNELYNSFVEAQADTASQLGENGTNNSNGRQLTMSNGDNNSASKQDHVFNLVNFFENLCSDYLRVLTDLNSKRAQTDKDMHLCSKLETMLREERNSWRLARAIFRDYLVESNDKQHCGPDSADDENSPMGGTIDMDQDNMPPMSDQQLIETLYQRNHTVRRMQLVADWLEANEADDLSNQSNQTDKAEYYPEGPTAWENTFHAMRTRSKTPSMATMRHSKPELCGAMDPDAPIRTKKPLADLDKEDEYRMFKHIFKFVRAGRLEEGQEVAVRVGYHWFAAALDGWLPYSDPNFDATSDKDIGDNDNAGAIKPITGNRRCDVWKLTCYKTAQMHGLAPYEKAILGVFGGNLKSVLPICSRWSDQLWARLKSAIDVIIVRAIQQSAAPTLDNEPRTTADYPDAYYENYEGLIRIFETIDAQKISSSSREACIHQTIQKYFILNDMDGLLNQLLVWCRQLDFEESNPDTVSPHYLRFFAHVVLFLRDIGYVRHDNRQASEILDAYIGHLIQLRRIQAVAVYTSALPRPNQILSYAKLLKTVTESDERKLCLKVAQEHKLDVDEITQAVVELIRKEPPPENDVPLTDTERELLAKTTTRDRRKIAALDWLLYTGRPNYVAIIHQGNALMRSFALERKIDAVDETFVKLPNDLYEMVEKQWRVHTNHHSIPVDLENDRREYMCFRLQLEVRNAFAAWSEYHRRKPEEPKKPNNISKFCDSVGYEQKMKQYQLDMAQWIEYHKNLSGNVASKIFELFNYQGGWFMDLPSNERRLAPADSQGNPDDSADSIVTLVVSRSESQVERRRQLGCIRKFFVPQLVFLLYNVLHLSEQYKECLRIADIVAEESTQLYKEFDLEQMRELLEKMRLASLCILKTCPDSLGYADTQSQEKL